jgi:hypothetical protein
MNTRRTSAPPPQSSGGLPREAQWRKEKALERGKKYTVGSPDYIAAHPERFEDPYVAYSNAMATRQTAESDKYSRTQKPKSSRSYSCSSSSRSG